METTISKVIISLVMSPIDNINLRTKEIIDQELIEELIIDRKTDLIVYNLSMQQLETIKLDKLDTKIHWYHKNDKLYKIIHIVE